MVRGESLLLLSRDMPYTSSLAYSGEISMLKLYPFILVLLLQAAGCASLITGGLAEGGYQSSPQDRATNARVAKELKSNTRLNTSRVRINTYKGTVTLNGFVGSPRAEQQAVEIARRVLGVKRVVSRLTVSTK